MHKQFLEAQTYVMRAKLVRLVRPGQFSPARNILSRLKSLV